LGPEFEAIIGTVRNVGYRFSAPNNQTTADSN
jgi:DNA-binding response OmpR family regulator